MTLDDLVDDPRRVVELPPHLTAQLLAQVAGLQTLLLSRLLDARGHERPGLASAQEDRLLTVKQAAPHLGMTEDYLYRHADRYPFTVRPAPRQLRFSMAGVQRFIRQRHGRSAV